MSFEDEGELPLERSRQNPRLVVIGGGISGLAAACRFAELEPHGELLLCEAGPRLGGLLGTTRRDGFLVEHSADSFITDPFWAVDFCRRHGLESSLISTSAAGGRALVVHRGRLVALPEGFTLLAPRRVWPLVTTPLLSLRGKLRLLCEPLVPRRAADAPEESLAEFATRRLGRETFERIVQPLVAGIYSADPARLSVAATLPRFLEMESRYGSLTRGARRMRRAATARGNGGSGARYDLFLAPRDGMSSLVDAIAARLPAGAIRLGTEVTAVERAELGRGLQLRFADQTGALDADALVVATSAPGAAALVDGLDPEAAELIRGIPLAGCAIVSLGYKLDATNQLPDAFGFVVPAMEQRPILAASFSSSKFADRAPVGHALVRVFFGGAGREEMLRKGDEELVRLAIAELAELVGLSGEPVLTMVTRWPAAMPQFHVGHRELSARIRARIESLGPVALAGNAWDGVGIPHCIRAGETAAEEALSRYRRALTTAAGRP